MMWFWPRRIDILNSIVISFSETDVFRLMGEWEGGRLAWSVSTATRGNAAGWSFSNSSVLWRLFLLKMDKWVVLCFSFPFFDSFGCASKCLVYEFKIFFWSNKFPPLSDIYTKAILAISQNKESKLTNMIYIISFNKLLFLTCIGFLFSLSISMIYIP